MLHSDHLITTFDERGNPIGSKPRGEIDKVRDIVHCADVFVFDGESRIVLGRIPANVAWGGNTWATPCATMVRVDESPEEAALRALQKELGIASAELHSLGTDFFSFPDGVKRVKTSFWIRHADALTPNSEDVSELRSFTREELENEMQRDPISFQPVFESLWAKYKTALPF